LVVMDGGKIVAHGTPRELIAAHATREVLELRFNDQDTAAEKLRGSDGATAGEGRVEVLPDRIIVYAHDGEAALATVHAMGLTPLTALVRRATLEDVFLKLTGRSLID
jgi:lipooligosaccharide transport system ATP-binding protein